MKNNYSFRTTGEKYKDVWKESRCLRCYSSKHRAANCPTYTRPTTFPCKNCWYLYHDTESCKLNDANGKSRSSSKERTAWQDLPINTVESRSLEDIIGINYCIEDWENEFDFHYFSDINYNLCPHELSVFLVTQSIKAKFRYPVKDPKPNLITDNRSDSAKVSDIIRIWSQI